MKSLLDELKELGGYYNCPRGEDGRRLGPLVGYAGTYKAPDGQKKQKVGDVYANFAKMEEQPIRMMPFVRILGRKIEERLDELYPEWDIDVFLGAPEGGKALAGLLALESQKLHLSDEGAKYIYPEKEILELKTTASREKSQLVFSRHELEEGKRVVIVEDVCNNFSTTDSLIRLVQECGSEVLAIACLLNRSMTVGNVYQYVENPTSIRSEIKKIPVIAIKMQGIADYRQDDPAVADDVAAGNVVWKPKDKDGWPHLMTAMTKAVK